MLMDYYDTQISCYYFKAEQCCISRNEKWNRVKMWTYSVLLHVKPYILLIPSTHTVYTYIHTVRAWRHVYTHVLYAYIYRNTYIHTYTRTYIHRQTNSWKKKNWNREWIPGFSFQVAGHQGRESQRRPPPSPWRAVAPAITAAPLNKTQCWYRLRWRLWQSPSSLVGTFTVGRQNKTWMKIIQTLIEQIINKMTTPC